MSQPNLELVRSIYAGWARGDFDANAWAHPNIELAFADGPEPRVWSGLAGMAEGYRDFLSAWKDFRAVPEDYVMVDDARILVLVRNSGRGRVSGLEIDERSVANLFEVRAGKVARIVVYLDREHAFADLGMRPREAGR